MDHLQLLLVLASTVILWSESYRFHDHILLSQTRDSPNLEGQVLRFISPMTGFPSHHLLLLARLQWRYSNLPSQGGHMSLITSPCYVAQARTAQETSLIIACSLVAGERTFPQNCSLATAVVLSPVYTAVTR
jgi:hypothetical protein